MSFQAYLDNIEEKTGLTPRQLVEQATAKGFGPETKAKAEALQRFDPGKGWTAVNAK